MANKREPLVAAIISDSHLPEAVEPNVRALYGAVPTSSE